MEVFIDSSTYLWTYVFNWTQMKFPVLSSLSENNLVKRLVPIDPAIEIQGPFDLALTFDCGFKIYQLSELMDPMYV